MVRFTRRGLAFRGGGKLAFRFLLNAAVAALGRRTAAVGRRAAFLGRLRPEDLEHLQQLVPRPAHILLASPLHL